MQILLSNSQAGPGRLVKQEQEEISRNHVQAFITGSVDGLTAAHLSAVHLLGNSIPLTAHTGLFPSSAMQFASQVSLSSATLRLLEVADARRKERSKLATNDLIVM